METGKSKHLFPVFYVLAMVLVVLYAWNEQKASLRGGSPIYSNLMDNATYIRRGFNIEDTFKIPSYYEGTEWFRDESMQKNIIYSPLPDLPKRPFLSPWGRDVEEFTIIIPVEMDSKAISFLDDNPSFIPGINFASIGENWEVFLNGTSVKSEIYIDRNTVNGKINIRESRTWRNAYFPVDRNLFVPGTNIIALRIIGDPSYIATGPSLKTHHYLDDYRIIERRRHNFLHIALCSIFGFIGIYYIMIFLSIRDKREIFNLYFGFFSILLCIYTFTRHSIVNVIIPNSDISIRLEFASMMLMIPVFCFFIETLIRGKISFISKIYMVYCSLLSVTQVFFCSQYGEEVVRLWNLTVIIYCTYFLFYRLIYFCFWNKDGLQTTSPQMIIDTHIFNALFGMFSLYICGIYEILQFIIFRNDFSFFQYSIFMLQIGMVFNLTQRFNSMYKKLEQSNIMLETTVKERTSELQEQEEIALELSAAKNRFLATINNELKTPLSNIAADIQLAYEKVENGEAKDLIQKTWNETLQMANHVSGALDDLQWTRSTAGYISIGALRFDLVAVRVFFIKSASENKDLLLSPKEFALLYTLARNEGKILSAKYLYETVWKQQYSNTDNATLRAHIKNLKKKLDDNACKIIIESIRGEGYRLAAEK